MENILSNNISILHNLALQDQNERNKYKQFISTKMNNDYHKGAKKYSQLHNRSEDDIFDDATRQNIFRNLNFDFNYFSEKEWYSYWILVQHADDDPNFQKKALRHIASYLGQNNDYYRFLFDRISCNQYGVQKYNTQNICKKINND